MDHLEARQGHLGRGRLRHVRHDRVQPDRQGRPRPGYPAYAPLADAWLEGMATNPYFAADPTPALKDAADKVWGGWGLVTYPDQPVWSEHGGDEAGGRRLAELIAAAPRRAPSLTPPKRLGMQSQTADLDRASASDDQDGRAVLQPPCRSRVRVACTGGGASRSWCPTCCSSSSSASCRCSTRSSSPSPRRAVASPEFRNFTHTAKDYRFVPALVHVLLYTSVWLGLLMVFVVALALLLHGRASRASSTFRFLYYLPGALAGAASVLVWLFMLDPSVSPGSFFVHHVLGAHLFVESIAPGQPALHLRDDRVLDRRRRLGRRPVRRAEHDPAGAGGRRPYRWRRPPHARPSSQAPADPEVDRLHGDPVLRDRDPALRRAAAGQPGEPGDGPRHVVVQPAGATSSRSGTGTSTAPPRSRSTSWRSGCWAPW